MRKHRLGLVHGQVHGLAALAVGIPEHLVLVRHLTFFVELALVLVVEQFVSFEARNRVSSRDTRQLTQTEVLHRTLDGGEHFEHIGIVKHGAIQEQTLLVR